MTKVDVSIFIFRGVINKNKKINYLPNITFTAFSFLKI
jgi:hypothetical protein